MKEARTKVSESVEGEIETFQGGQVVQLFTLQSREKVEAGNDIMFRFYVLFLAGLQYYMVA